MPEFKVIRHDGGSILTSGACQKCAEMLKKIESAESPGSISANFRRHLEAAHGTSFDVIPVPDNIHPDIVLGDNGRYSFKKQVMPIIHLGFEFVKRLKMFGQTMTRHCPMCDRMADIKCAGGSGLNRWEDLSCGHTICISRRKEIGKWFVSVIG